MKTSFYASSTLLFITAMLLSFTAGYINGFFGTGSGFFFMLISRILPTSPDVKIGSEERKKEMYTFSMSCVIPVSLVSLFLYGNVPLNLPFAGRIAVPAILGGILGGFIKEKIRFLWLNLAFAALTIYSGISMIIRCGLFS